MELEKQGRDYAVAIRTAHIMKRLGLQEVDVRMNDRVELVTPDRPEYEEKKRDFLDYNDWNTGLSDREREQVILHLLSHGLTGGKPSSTVTVTGLSLASSGSTRRQAILL